MRGCDPNAAINWLVKTVTDGDDPEFIARRLITSVSQVIGPANSGAVRLVLASFEACGKMAISIDENHRQKKPIHWQSKAREMKSEMKMRSSS
jgi:replication-associated recombination protein RarA